jgi:beta-glucosidase
MWKTKAIERLGIPSIVMTDGPHGVRKVSDIEDPVGASEAIPATYFPSAATLGCSWDRDLM